MPTVRPRLRSLDALRGFDMFWIIGGDEIASQIGKLAHSPSVSAVTDQFSQHMEWVGFRYYDMIFPLFLFIIGTAIPFAIGRRLDEGESRRSLLIKVLRRTAVLFLLGVIYSGLLRFHGWDHVRIFGVLQRQAFGYGAASILYLYTKPRTQVILAVAILLLYWLLLVAIHVPPVPGHPTGPFTQWGNVPNYVDRLILRPGQMYEKYGDPEGPVSDLPAIVTALLGVFAGRWLRSERSSNRKAAGLAAAGVACLAVGLAWSPILPVIKKIWTSSYVLVAGGASLLLLALFYWVIDGQGRWKWSVPLAVIGMNAITIYIGSEIIDFGHMADYFFSGALHYVPDYRGLGLAIGTVLFEWLFLYGLWRQKWFFRV